MPGIRKLDREYTFEQFVEISIVVLNSNGYGRACMTSTPCYAVWTAAVALEEGGGWLIHSLGQPCTGN